MNKYKTILTVSLGALLLVALLASLYFRLSQSAVSGPVLEQGIPGGSKVLPMPSVTVLPSPEEPLSVQSESDDPGAISKDIDDTDFSVLDRTSAQIEAELTSP
ncbi:MAG: hypothetical protein UX31_C0012G0004 [Candidatus Nomurabacteria bacterium GW2011_GWA1_46_11]|uniref:Uncharacterized protein n=1 Tax=Candidatus Nomurabacteria bacterium GW2011_GWA1_46_11 TaxID=1618732 RepID=A0A0G1QVD9_9BACT|nr:MAG: hypothetical protein UW69_C0058G0003 [Microgenomates group bacterium GW2011_GWA2_44_7]KKT77944.1 MAG: hypothetical protein UW73_C0009G0043 [Microgenomates group bacterium GW2011_GWB1_44_8]KKU21768.1 MAG: hypothetical protein UX31_C0012G0004 [Candidatus Nomurabacteria bacterium GW2011_GWA1_46_11]